MDDNNIEEIGMTENNNNIFLEKGCMIKNNKIEKSGMIENNNIGKS